ncbi:unnamed protein product [Spirodela intermedia]|uniref:Uncharacterized protein n=1 Tax=Spirodela intermedia TaxID=51605 RepID=A0A7I8IJR6_SPIIN|nr:unnamed protein product [Spirodela intermedia]CAA6658000.1 unnamed protein product [Spirodela intermedia]
MAGPHYSKRGPSQHPQGFHSCYSPGAVVTAILNANDIPGLSSPTKPHLHP